MPKLNLRLRRSPIAAAHDLLMAALSLPLAMYLRLGGVVTFHDALLFTAVFGTMAFHFRLQRGAWRYVSMRELFAIVKVATLSIVAFYLLLFLAVRLEGIPRSVPFIHWLVLLALLSGPRVIYRALRERSLSLAHEARRAVPVLLVGYHHNAEQFVRELQRTPQALYRVIGIVDDTAAHRGRVLHGIPVYGGVEDLPAIVRKLALRDEKPQRVIVGDDHLDSEKISQLLALCDELGLTLARLPRLTDFKSGDTRKITVRPVAIEDVLGRSQTVHERKNMRAFIEGKTILITGAGGTIGGELTRQITRFQPKALILLDVSEYNLYRVDLELTEENIAVNRKLILADIRDAKNLNHIFSVHRPDIVFHAAAIKHVPLAESNAEEAILTNVFGTRNVADACHQHRVAAMVMISTDKAVNPTNVMGASKRLAERYVGGFARQPAANGTHFITVRFGNVLGSTGSVIPLFQRQLEAGGPLTITHPEMTRYFMTVREAVELVIQSAALGQAMQGNHAPLFVLDMGRPMRITALAEQMIRLAGLRPGEDIALVYTGLRPGEKLHEELFYPEEKLASTSESGILVATHNVEGGAGLHPLLESLYEACKKREREAALTLLSQLVPEYQPLKAIAA